MPKFAIFFSYESDAMAAMLEKPDDRAAAARKALEATGGKLEAYYWMLGPYDGFAIVDAPDSQTVAAYSLSIGSSGAFSKIETAELFEPGAISGLVAKAKRFRESYRAPGE